MYTYNIFCFGHELAKNKELNNLLDEFDLEFKCKIGDKIWEIYFPYHGGQVDGDTLSCIFGCKISHNDRNPNWLKTIRGAKKEDYIFDYGIFLKKLFTELESPENLGIEEEYDNLVDSLREWVYNNEPDFYMIEASS